MENEPKIEFNLEKINKFKELFHILETSKLGGEYINAYEEAVDLAKYLVQTKNKPLWNSDNFVEDFGKKYINLPEEYLEALKRCVKNYNPPVNIPNEPLW